MAYTPINWQTGDTITADRLNKMDNGWSVTSGTTTICDETVTTEDDGGIYVGQLSVSSITNANITVTYDGTPYQCAQDGDGGYGTDVSFTFADYPFRIESDGFIITETAGTHSVKIDATVSSVETSAAFASAVADVLPLLNVVQGETTWQQVHDAIVAGKMPVFVYEENDSAFFYKADSVVYNVDDGYYRVHFDGGNFTMIAASADSALYSE